MGGARPEEEAVSRAYPTSPRCVRCRMIVDACICDAILPVDTSTRVELVVHWMEWNKTTNTSALLARVLLRSKVHIRGVRDRPLALDRALRDPDRRPVLLYPAEDAVPLDTIADEGPFTLIVPDGTWRQARRVHRREPALADVRTVTLPVGAPSRYRVRKNVRGDFALSTAEAVARALGILEGEAIERAVLGPFDRMVEATLRLRGK